ncbi:MAG: hypothetical protein L6V93_14250 [Clostridiales bacterium]|nr:MAG: hypothetical protein L6V93_14250 [Clostridiales bacterium]
MADNEIKNGISPLKWLIKCASPRFLSLAVLTLVSVAVSVISVYFCTVLERCYRRGNKC